jgi:hypothetical protein
MLNRFDAKKCAEIIQSSYGNVDLFITEELIKLLIIGPHKCSSHGYNSSSFDEFQALAVSIYEVLGIAYLEGDTITERWLVAASGMTMAASLLAQASFSEIRRILDKLIINHPKASIDFHSHPAFEYLKLTTACLNNGNGPSLWRHMPDRKLWYASAGLSNLASEKVMEALAQIWDIYSKFTQHPEIKTPIRFETHTESYSSQSIDKHTAIANLDILTDTQVTPELSFRIIVDALQLMHFKISREITIELNPPLLLSELNSFIQENPQPTVEKLNEGINLAYCLIEQGIQETKSRVKDEYLLEHFMDRFNWMKGWLQTFAKNVSAPIDKRLEALKTVQTAIIEDQQEILAFERKMAARVKASSSPSVMDGTLLSDESKKTRQQSSASSSASSARSSVVSASTYSASSSALFVQEPKGTNKPTEESYQNSKQLQHQGHQGQV